MYRRLLQFLRPHAWRMAGTVACNIAAAVLDVFSFTLLIPFLDRLFNQPAHETKLSALQNQLLGAFLNGESPEAALLRIVIIILVAVTAKNVFVWASGQLGAQLQEYVTRDLRNALYAHLQRLPLGFFVRVKTGDILARVLNDTQQTKQVITQVVTQSLLSVATVVVTIAGLIAISWRLTLLAVFMQHSDSKPQQQRILCLGGIVEDTCSRPFLMISDVGLTFGTASRANDNDPSSVNLTRWRDTPVWRDEPGCVGNINKSFSGTLDRPVIGEDGRRFLAGLLQQLSDAQLHDLFEVARVNLRVREPGRALSGFPTIEEWVSAFKQKRDEISSKRCA